SDEYNNELTLNLVIYGRTYELIFRNSRDETRFTVLDPLETFVIYDDTVERNPIAGVRYYSKQFEDNARVVYLYTDTHIHEFELDNAYGLKETNVTGHYFEGVPIIEYEINKFRKGDFENVLTLIDLYDAAQSDTANRSEEHT